MLVQSQYPAQRWIAFQDISSSPSPSPSPRASHAMACDGTRVFVLGGRLAPDTDDITPIYVLDTGMYLLFFISFGQFQSLKTQNTSISRNPTPALSILARRAPRSYRSHHRVPRPKDNHTSHHLLRRMLMQLMGVHLFKKLPLMNWTTPAPGRLLTNKASV